jgi:hypothetical protein
MQGQPAGEIALKFGFNQGGDLQIESYYLPRNGMSFSSDELNTAYLQASKECENLQKDEEASQLLQDFATQLRGQEEKDVERVFTFDGHLPTVLGLTSRSGLDDDPLKLYGEPDLDEFQNKRKLRTVHELDREKPCHKCTKTGLEDQDRRSKETRAKLPVKASFAGKKYKPVDLKTKPVYTDLPERYRIKREITGDPLKDMPELPRKPVDFLPTGRYTAERKEIIDKIHEENFLWPEERKLMHNFMMLQEKAFAWDDNERGSFRQDFFPPVEIPTVEHGVWIEKSIPIPRGQLEEFCKVIKKKIDAGVYEPSNASYRTKFFGVIKKDGKSIRLVHSLEPLNAVTIAHSGIPPATDELASHFSGRACGAVLDLYSGYDHRDLADSSRDFTTFQTPFGALRLVKLPQGWTNSVPIFHDDVTFILRDEIPHITIPYIDDVPVRGPGSKYMRKNGRYETVLGNKRIRRFVWEHFQNLNRIVQRLKYSGATLSGLKALLCKSEFQVVGHIVSYEGRKPSTDRVGVIERWGACENVSEVRQFLGTVTYMRMFIRNFTIMARPLTLLLRNGIEFEWGEEQIASMDAIKYALAHCDALRPINYEWGSDVILAVDTSWIAIGIIIYQVDPDNPKKRYIVKYDSIPMNEREARFSQPKRELYGLKRALQKMQYWLLGCRKLVVETDAKYIKGMLSNPGMGPNATVNRWIEEILMFHFTLKHVQGLTFAADGLSRRKKQPGDEIQPSPEDGYDDNQPPENHPDWDYDIPQPLDLEEFKDDIDIRGGYYQRVIEELEEPVIQLASSIYNFQEECTKAYQEIKRDEVIMREAYEKEKLEIPQYLMNQYKEEEPLLPDQAFKFDPSKKEPYPEDHRTSSGIWQDKRLGVVKQWLLDPMKRPEGMTNKKYKQFIRYATQFFVDRRGRLYRKGSEGAHKLVISKEHRMYMIKASHDSLGHKGIHSTKSMIGLRFWWPEYERDVAWYIKTCHLCQVRQKELLRIPPVPTMTPSLFQKIHVDVMVMGIPSNNHKLVIAARDSLTRWLEARGLQSDNAEAIGRFLLESIICRWGCPRWIVTDNAGQFLAALDWLQAKYGITGIRISSYNSQANGPVERGHWDLRQSIFKATGGDGRKWFWFLPQVLWADRITTRRGLGCSPYFAVTGAHPTVPLDIVEATWLVEYPDHIISTAELVGLRAKALAKHIQHIGEMRQRVSAEKIAAVQRYERVHEHTIKDYNFKPGNLILVRNTKVEKSLNTKMEPRYLGPMVVVRRTQGGSYLVCELNGAMYPGKVAQFRVIPYEARKSIKTSKKIEDLIDMPKAQIDALAEKKRKIRGTVYTGKDLQFDRIRLNPNWEDESESSEEHISDKDEYDFQLEEDEPDYDEDKPRRSRRSRT